MNSEWPPPGSPNIWKRGGRLCRLLSTTSTQSPFYSATVVGGENTSIMPSKKKSRGRQNRAKKEATRTAELRTLWEPTILASDNKLDVLPSCEHKHELSGLQIPQEGTAVSFMNRMAGEGFFNKATRFPNEPVMETCYSLSRRFPGIRKEEDERALAIDLLLRFLCNVFVRDSTEEGEKWFNQRQSNEVAICCMIDLLELLGTYADWSVVERRAVKMGAKLVFGNRRDVVKFVAKRLPCTCLKGLHRAARRKVGKEGVCIGCYKGFPRTQLRVCTGCMIAEYCSRECQRANWSNHKKFCGCPEVVSQDLPSDYIFKRGLS
ncbi:hypothetical protein THAOC_04433 [Thalassiosira oceanica]|uniref:MYND-type domain-containing protein n=1 Tax=Thalassiosira oceanica TaxID=159749 RepID=K0TNW9_THAOC|nr:hypothetical protein THAOC_04433 [Thalassiosira oceanica]|eukprot:EJK73922.1 hypothetical protein THAOC_04433 [Thalassiosira oceanica]